MLILQGLAPDSTLDAECQAERHQVPFLVVFGMTMLGNKPQPPNLWEDTNHKATELIKAG